jgi:hypothetical protein
MNQGFVSMLLVISAALGGSPFSRAASAAASPVGQPDHIAWVVEVLNRMQSIQTGMTRSELLVVFTGEGGLYTDLRRTYVSRECPLFKVDVEFEAVGRPNRDSDGRVTLLEGDQDRIVKISRPYLQSVVVD